MQAVEIIEKIKPEIQLVESLDNEAQEELISEFRQIIMQRVMKESKSQPSKWAKWANKRASEKVLSGISDEIIEHNKEFRESFSR